MKTIRQILDGAALTDEQRKIVEYILGLQGYLPMDYGIASYGSKAEAAGIEILQGLIDAYNECNLTFAAMRKELAKRYVPHIAPWYYKRVLDLDVSNGAKLLLNGCIECNYRADSDKFWYREKIDGNSGDSGVFFIARWTGKHISQILTHYYSLVWGVDIEHNVEQIVKHLYFGQSDDDKPIVRDNKIESDKITSAVVMDLDAGECVNEREQMDYDDILDDCEMETTGDAIDPATWTPDRLGKQRYHRFSNFIKDKDGKWMKDIRLPNGVKCCKDHLMQQHDGVAWASRIRNQRDCDAIDSMKQFLYDRKMHLAVNQPKGGWSYDVRHHALVYEGIFAKSSKKEGQVRVAMLYRMMQPDKDGCIKKFAKGSKPIPYLLENVKTQKKDDKYIFVCEGMGDACFIRNGIALNNWIPTADYAMPFINRYKSKGCKIVYMTDNWMVGDKGGMRALMYAKKHDPERLMLDWGSIKCKAKDVGELVVEMDMCHYEGGKNLASERQHLVYEMPREWIMEHVKMAKDIDTRCCNTLDDNGYYNLDTIFS